ncbi:MAG: tetratricopeptide repeat protein [Anaerolineae bacterium]
MSLAEHSALYLRTHEQLDWIGRLTAEQNNLRAALSRALQAGWCEMALRLTSALFYYWHIRDFEAEGREWIRQVLLLAKDDPSLHQSIWYSQTLLGDAILRVWDADSTARRDLLYQALSRFEQQADDWGIGYSLQNLARLAYEQIDYDSARTFCERSLAIWQATRDAWGMSISHRTLALIAYQQADWQAWRMHLQQAADFARAAGDRWLLAPTLQYLGLDVWQRDGPLLGRAVVEESLAAFREIGNQVMVAALSNKLGEIARDQGDYSFAQESCAQAGEILRVWPDDWEIAWNFYCLGSIAFKSGDLPGARHRFEECLCSFRVHEHDAYHWLEGFVLGHLACVDIHEGQLTRAAKELERSWLLLAPRQETVDLSLTAFGIAELFRLQSQWSQAMACFQFSIAKLLEVQRAVNIVDCLEGMAKICAIQKQPAHSVRLLGAADGLRQQLGTPVPQIERADYGRCLSAAHRQIDSASFNELWAQGFGMTLPEVVAYAFDLTAQSGDQSPCAMLVASYQFS